MKWSEVLVPQSCPTLCDPIDYSLPGSSVHGILQARILEWVAVPFSSGSSQPRDWTQVSCIAGGFFTCLSYLLGKPKNTGVGSLSLLQRIFPTQELNQGLLHCRKILYCLKPQGSCISHHYFKMHHTSKNVIPLEEKLRYSWPWIKSFYIQHQMYNA